MKRRLLLQGSAMAAGFAAVASTAQAANAPAPVTGLQVEAVQMPAWANQNGQQRPLAPGDTVGTDQEVETGPEGALVLRMPEGSMIRLGEKTRLGIPQLAVDTDGGQTAVRSQLKLNEGFFRFTTSAVAKAVGRRDVEVSLRSATIGIRGTDFWSMTDAAHDAACLFEGRVDLATRDQGPLVLDKPTAFWARFFDKDLKPVGNATPDELAKFLKSTEVKPGRGIAVVGGRWRVVAGSARNDAAAAALVRRLRVAGYPAQLAGTDAAREVHINRLATEADAMAVIEKIGAIDGVRGRAVRVG